jgi:hypothetical protein
MLQVTSSTLTSTPLLQRVRATVTALGCEQDRVWARSSGGNVLLGLQRREPFARVVPLGNGSYGLAFRAMEARASHNNAWEPLLLVDDLESVVEHALIAVDAIPTEV